MFISFITYLTILVRIILYKTPPPPTHHTLHLPERFVPLPNLGWPGGGGTSLTEQQQFDIFGRSETVLLEVFLDGFAPVQSRPLLCAQGTSHG